MKNKQAGNDDGNKLRIVSLLIFFAFFYIVLCSILCDKLL